MPCSMRAPSNQSGIWMANRSRSSTLPAVSTAMASRKKAATSSVAESSRFIASVGVPGGDFLAQLVQRLLALHAGLVDRLHPLRVDRLGGLAPLVDLGRR